TRRLRRCAIACRSATSSPASCAPMAISATRNQSVASLPTRSRSAFPALASTSAAETWPSVSIRRLTRSRTVLAQSSRTYRARFRLASVAPTKSRSTTSSSTMPKPGRHRTWNHIARRRRRSSAPLGPAITTSTSCADEDGFVWIGVHFGSRGLGHTSATRYLKAAGGKSGINVPPALIDEDSELGRRYIAAMELAGRYAYAGREWVVERVRRIIGGAVTDTVHNHHNYAWRETHEGRDVW